MPKLGVCGVAKKLKKLFGKLVYWEYDCVTVIFSNEALKLGNEQEDFKSRGIEFHKRIVLG